MIPIPYYLVISAILFITGAVGVLLRRNALIMLMSLELMLNAVNLSFVAYARMLNDTGGHVIVFLNIAVAAAEAVVGLAILADHFPQPRVSQHRSPEPDAALSGPTYLSPLAFGRRCSLRISFALASNVRGSVRGERSDQRTAPGSGCTGARLGWSNASCGRRSG